MSLSLSEAQSLSIGELTQLSSTDLMQLQIEANTLAKNSKSLKEWIEGAIAFKYATQANSTRQRMGKETGTVHFEDAGIRITTDVAKKPTWDQQKLADIANRIAVNGDDPAEYLEISYKVSERKYTAWPQSLRDSFAPARTLKTGKPTFQLKPISEVSP